MSSFLRAVGVATIVSAGLVANVHGQDAFGPTATPSYRAMNILKHPALRAELELIAEQIESLIALEAERQLIFRGPLMRGDQPTVEERREAYAESKRQLWELEKRAVGVLLPHQRRRLDQILLQEAVGAFEPSGGVTHPKLAPRLDLEEPQLETVRQTIIAADKEFKDRMKELLAEMTKAREVARAKVLAELTPDQRKTYEELIGKPFDLAQPE